LFPFFLSLSLRPFASPPATRFAPPPRCSQPPATHLASPRLPGPASKACCTTPPKRSRERRSLHSPSEAPYPAAWSIPWPAALSSPGPWHTAWSSHGPLPSPCPPPDPPTAPPPPPLLLAATPLSRPRHRILPLVLPVCLCTCAAGRRCWMGTRRADGGGGERGRGAAAGSVVGRRRGARRARRWMGTRRAGGGGGEHRWGRRRGARWASGGGGERDGLARPSREEKGHGAHG
jgi:hypothetical protein